MTSLDGDARGRRRAHRGAGANINVSSISEQDELELTKLTEEESETSSLSSNSALIAERSDERRDAADRIVHLVEANVGHANQATSAMTEQVQVFADANARLMVLIVLLTTLLWGSSVE